MASTPEDVLRVINAEADARESANFVATIRFQMEPVKDDHYYFNISEKHEG